MKKIYLIASILILVILGVEVLYLAQSNNLATESVRAEELMEKITALEEKNQILESEVLSYSSLQVVASRAADLGFEKPEEFIMLKDSDSIALKHE